MNGLYDFPPYWQELGYKDCGNGLFLRRYVDENNELCTTIEVNAEDFHRIRKENLRRIDVTR